ncbi:DNA-binding response regulator [Actinoplanes lobatus]|uniref:DNA-binding NarL/FixJ family response regulator n=1 Tax=Actinoplanes lobatus TaxID=113568 RepID=A0A7W7HP28_9ACTN|nr:response regulator transcription factor [Actinoplanes lobatus]MBB4754089.1 DNA-binding NarL/FixJ family response regulator [Actinoplanes lobatus]GGN76788.1 DNA-binding response regulator [Actinoplanes lobatus]GIE40855.1 DNA-binding response regulator [Actinoplanes lobatus]
MIEGQPQVRVLVVDGQPLIRNGIVLLLDRQPGIRVVAQTGDPDHAVTLSHRHRPDLVVLDLPPEPIPREPATPRSRAGVCPGVIQRLTGIGPIRVLVIAANLDRTPARRALLAGAAGFLLKESDPDVLVSAVHAIARGGAWLDPELAHDLLREYVTRPAAAAPGLAEMDRLTPREQEVLALIAQGLDNSEVAALLFVAECTVKTHLGRILTKLGLRDRSQAVAAAYRTGLVRVSPPRLAQTAVKTAG